MPPRQVGFLRRFGLKTGVHFAHFGLESGMVFEGISEYKNVFIVSIPNRSGKEREICELEMDLKNTFVFGLIKVLITKFLPKTGSKNGYGF